VLRPFTTTATRSIASAACLDSYRFVDAALQSRRRRQRRDARLDRSDARPRRGDPLFLQVKEAQRSVLEPYTAPSEFANQGERVVQGQRSMQAASDILLGWVRARGADGERR
jgi:hypothetical protein